MWNNLPSHIKSISSYMSFKRRVKSHLSDKAFAKEESNFVSKLQPNLDTRKKQVDGWCSLILAYHKHGKKYTLDVTEAHSSDLFNNKKIDRKLSIEAMESILEELRKKGHVEWTDASRKRCLVMWRTPAEWGKLIYAWINDRGMNNTVCTFFEITSGDDSEDQEFHGLETPILMRALKSLEKQHKAEIMGDDGVKFF